MHMITSRIHRFEHTLNDALEWVDTSPLPSRLFKITALFLGAVAISPFVPVQITSSVTVSLVCGAFSISCYVLSRMLHRSRNTLFQDLNSLTNAYDHFKQTMISSPEVQKQLKAYWTEEKLYTMLYDPNATDFDKWAFTMIPNTTKFLIEAKKKDVERRCAEVQKTHREQWDKILKELELKRIEYTRTELTMAILCQLSDNIAKTADEQESEHFKSAYIDCQETADENAAEIQTKLQEQSEVIKDLEEEKAHLTRTQSLNSRELEALRRHVCRDSYVLLQND